MAPTIDTIVFDLGRVLVNFNFEPFLAYLKSHGGSFQDVKDFIQKTNLDGYEAGEITCDQFVTNMNTLLPKPLKENEIALACCEYFHFSPIDEMVALAKTLGQKYKVCILSNTTLMHWQYLCDKLSVHEYVHHSLTSFEAGARKPHSKIYKEAEKRLGLIPQASIFIDDLLENAEGAKHCGWHGIHHVSPEKTKKELQLLGVSW